MLKVQYIVDSHFTKDACLNRDRGGSDIVEGVASWLRSLPPNTEVPV